MTGEPGEAVADTRPTHTRTGLWLRGPVDITVSGASVAGLMAHAAGPGSDTRRRHGSTWVRGLPGGPDVRADARREILGPRALPGSPPRVEFQVRRYGGRAGTAVAHLVAQDSPAGLHLTGSMKGPAGIVVVALWFGVISSIFSLTVVLAATEGVGAAFGTLALALFMWAMTALVWTTGRGMVRWLESDLRDPEGSFQQALRGR